MILFYTHTYIKKTYTYIKNTHTHIKKKLDKDKKL